MKKRLIVLSFFIFHISFITSLASWADIGPQLERFGQTDRQEELVSEANAFFRQLYEEEFLDTLYIYNSSTPAGILREQVWYWAAEYLYEQQQYEQAETYGMKALPLIRQADNSELEADCLSLLAIIHVRLSNYEKAVGFAKECYKLDEASGDPDRMSSSLNTLAGIYMAANQPEQAEQYVLKGVELAGKAGNPGRQAVLLGMASEVYHAMGDDEQALAYIQQAYELEQQLGREYKAMVRLSQKASVLVGLHRYQEAEQVLAQVIPYFREVGDRQSLGISCNKMGMTLLCQEQQGEAVTYYKEAAAIFLSIGDKSNEMHARKGLYESLWAIQPDSAKMELDRFNELKDSLYNTVSAESLARYNAEFGNDWLQQENEAERAARRRVIMVAIIAVCGLLLLSVLIWWLMRCRQHRQAAINLQLSANIAELREKYKELSVRYDNAMVTGATDEQRENLAAADRDFLEKTVDIINEHLLNGQADAESVAEQMNMSLFQFRQRLSSLTNETPQSFVALIRMRRARYLLDNRPELNISEVAQLCAYNDTSNFSRAFKKTFGITPTQYVEKQKEV